MNFNKILRSLLLMGIFGVTLVPLYVSSSMFFPFITGKNFAFRIVVEIMVGLWLILLYRDKETRPKCSWLLVSLTAYLLMATLATIFGQNPLRSFWSNFERMEGLVAYIHSYLFFIISISVIKSRETWWWLLNTTVFVSVLTSFVGLQQLLGKAEIHQSASRLDATLGNSAYLATYTLIHIFILGYLFFTTAAKNKVLRWTYFLLAILELTILYFTATRGAILGLIGGVILFLLLTAWKRGGSARKVSLVALGVIVVAVSLFWSLRTAPFISQNKVLGRFANISLTDGTTQSRFLIWNMSLQGFKEHPLLGWGPENYPLVFQKYYAPSMWSQEPWFDRSHNVILDNLINFGVLGLLAYLSIFAGALYYLWEGLKKEDNDGLLGRVVLICLLAAYFFQNIFVFDNLTSVILFYLVAAYIHSVYGKEEIFKSETVVVQKNKSRVNSEESGAFLPVVIILAVAVSATSLYYFSLRGITVSQTLISAISRGTPQERLADFKKIFNYGPVMGQTEAREQLMNASRSVVGDKNIPNEVKLEFVTLTNSEMNKQFAVSPDDARSRLFYGVYLSNLNQTAEALNQLSLAYKLAPKKQMIMFEYGSLLAQTGRMDEAKSIFRQAFEEDQTYDEARKIYALVSLYSKDVATAKQVLGADPEIYIKGDSRFDQFREVLNNN